MSATLLAGGAFLLVNRDPPPKLVMKWSWRSHVKMNALGQIELVNSKGERIGDPQGIAQSSFEGGFRAEIADPKLGRVTVTLPAGFSRELRFGMDLHSILSVRQDGRGTIYVVVLGELPSKSGRAQIRAMCLDPREGRPQGDIEFPPGERPFQNKPFFAVTEDGVLYARETNDGWTVDDYRCVPFGDPP